MQAARSGVWVCTVGGWGGVLGARLGSPSCLTEHVKACAKLGHPGGVRLPDGGTAGAQGCWHRVLPWSTAQGVWLQWGFAELGQTLAMVSGVELRACL